MNANIKVGIIGCGYWGPNLLRNFAENEAAELRWICDLNAQRLAAMGRRYPAAVQTADYKALLADPSLDAVVIATPVWTHFSFAKQALEAGKHILVEKPLTASAAEAEQLVELADRKGLTLMVDHTFIYTGAVRKIKDIVLSGDLGDLLCFRTTSTSSGISPRMIFQSWIL